MLILDCSVTIAWCVESETTAFTEAVLAAVARDGAVAPGLWAIEVANVLSIHERRKILTNDKVRRFREILAKFNIQLEHHTRERMLFEVLDLSRKLGLSAYDATYLDLAMQLRLPLATLDRPLLEAAKKVNVEIFHAAAE
ncbi:MAG: type II toxin-antitoxin system VapC family toxin [Planctomycetes bacterium]|nr:type II toxin-antitoxin system VapC family toxin [Planctomycetota bacterium]